MKNFILITTICIAIVSLSFNILSDHRAAKVKAGNPLLFIYCEPTADFDVLGRVDIGLLWEGSNNEVYGNISKRAVKKYPSVDGVIMSDDYEYGIAIKFKD